MSTSIKTFTKTGKTAPGVGRSSIPVANLGSFDPSTGRVYQKPRLSLNPLKGRSVKITNPVNSTAVANQRTRSIGAGAAGQQKRYT